MHRSLVSRIVVALVAALGAVAPGCTSATSSGAANNIDGSADGSAPYIPARPIDANDDWPYEGDPYAVPAFFPAEAGLPNTSVYAGPGFLLRTDGTAAFTNRLGGQLTAIMRALRTRFPPRSRDALRPFEACVFASLEDFHAYASAHAPEVPHSLGYYDPRPRRVLTGDQGDDPSLLATLLHESTHAVLRDHTRSLYIPLWLDEGFATYCETGRIEAARVRFGSLHRRFALIAYNRVVLGERMSLQTLATIGRRGFALSDKRTREACYAEAWAWVYYLLHDGAETWGHLLDEYVDAVTEAAVQRRTDASLAYPELYKSVFAPHAVQLEADFESFAREAFDY